MKWLGVHFSLWAGFCALAAGAEPIHFSHEVRSESGLTCRAHLWVPKDSDPQALVFFAYGTGVYSVEEALNPVGEVLLEDRLTAILSVEKPGVSFQDGKAKVDRQTYARHLPRDLVDCAGEALRWAAAKVLPSRIALSGHSAGAETVLDLIRGLQERGDPLAEKVVQLQLYGPPLEAWPELVRKQIARMEETRRQAFSEAFERRDADFFLALENGAIPLGYLDAAFASPSLASRLKQSVGCLPETIIFQGKDDARCEVSATRCLELDLPEVAHPNLHFKYFAKGHTYEPDSIREILAAIRRALSE